MIELSLIGVINTLATGGPHGVEKMDIFHSYAMNYQRVCDLNKYIVFHFTHLGTILRRDEFTFDLSEKSGTTCWQISNFISCNYTLCLHL
jgi:hypothetical protein